MSDWIKASDRKPAYRTPVLTWHKGAGQRIMTLDTFYEKDVWWCSLDDDHYYQIVHDLWSPTHWQPLPMPPEEDKP